MIETRLRFDFAEKKMVVQRTQDVQPILEFNKKLYNLNDGYNADRTFRRVASIPNVVIEKWLREGVNVYRKEHWPEVRRRLNDSENLYLRTAPGRV